MARAIQRIASFLKLSYSNDFLQTKKIFSNQIAGLIALHDRDEDYERPKPFPYKTQKYGSLTSYFDPTSWRFDENTKLIVVEGPVNSGKEEIAKNIARHYDLLYVPNVNMDIVYKNAYGYDLRVINDKIVKKLRTYDIHEFLANPKDERTPHMQLNLFKARIYQYMDTLLHILSTGQGAVMNRSMYSEFVYFESFMKMGYLPRSMRNIHYLIRNSLIKYLMRPHLVIYLDIPVNKVMENIKRKNDPAEVNSPVLQPEFHQMIEKTYRQKYLDVITPHTDVLKLDVSQPLDYDLIFEALDAMKLERGDFDKRFTDWYYGSEGWLCMRRTNLSAYRQKLLDMIEMVSFHNCPELWVEYQDLSDYSEALCTIPGMKYEYGFNEDAGDYFTFKTRLPFRMLTQHAI